MNTHLVLKSRNFKTGPIPVSVTSADTCPPACPLNKNPEHSYGPKAALMGAAGCYAKHGPLGVHWGKVSTGARGGTWAAFCAAIAALPAGQLWRHNAAGDLPGKGNVINGGMLSKLAAANVGRAGFTYTHKPVLPGDGTSARIAGMNAQAIANANRAGFTINLSANNPAHADKLADLGIGPVVVLLPPLDDATIHTERCPTSASPAGRKIVTCPATYRDDVNCESCGLCQRWNNQGTRTYVPQDENRPRPRPIVGFPAHGTGARRAEEIARHEPAAEPAPVNDDGPIDGI